MTAPFRSGLLALSAVGVPYMPPDGSSNDGHGGVILLLALGALFLIRVCIEIDRKRDRRAQAQAAAIGPTAIAISQLPGELQEPLQAFRQHGVEYISPAQLAEIYDECARIAEHRTRLYEHQAQLIKARTAHDLAVAAAKFIATLNHEERAVLQMRIEAQVRLDVDRLRAENAQLATEVAHYRNLLPGRR